MSLIIYIFILIKARKFNDRNFEKLKFDHKFFII